MRTTVLLLSLGLPAMFLLWILGKNYEYRLPPQSLTSSYLSNTNLVMPATRSYIADDLPNGYDRSGKTDYTALIQRAVNENKVTVFPSFPLLINMNGLTVPSDRILIFQKNSILLFSGPATAKYSDIIKVYNAENVRIVNAKIRGSRNEKAEQRGEWSAGISILNSRNIVIENPRIYDTFGDGIFIGSEDNGYSENIYISNGWIDNVRRNGISITSAKNVFVNHILISNTHGTLPECGVDIEPSVEDHIMQNVNLNDVYTFNNSSGGISVNMNALGVKERSRIKTVNINITRHTDDGSAYAFTTSLNDIKGLYDAQGYINITGSHWQNNRSGLYWKSDNEQRIKLNFKKLKTDSNGKTQELVNFLKKQKNIAVSN
ncbi:right-handed parallel beta-helix repeat-containing protein [Chryseobacterium sp.]|uniref:right-handed parallel beta-helix repeat-containing protein n=1 Tax=Chryseobacterium sp. TaxID=1871047 RepID=UPI0011CBD1D5|nr:right-handed parallel beta-helix repeat-containing protein [Chryseobacterium sp.]TXF77558.1 right-handed parallel beta-helix repeat-containing protein [Chryseobacterium sp.]